MQKIANTKWMLSCIDPSPLAFFRFAFLSHRSRAFDTYSKVLESALEQCEDQMVKERLLKMKEYDIQIQRSIQDTNVNVQQKINSLVDNSNILPMAGENTGHNDEDNEISKDEAHTLTTAPSAVIHSSTTMIMS
ncbi:hypothetical protein BC937DRAFT_86733 [Endogone sp. FLAS-F59071]|nr:hypothetical protein BC937DRAFT_86733 [Endogone sp. FLAS-F59071]|eukprot:RUS19900.1 hypothetical protein BC937DRAFT_86733 [Endogone sp. FLAS-F59071]